jgi:hypothetical protein
MSDLLSNTYEEDLNKVISIFKAKDWKYLSNFNDTFGNTLNPCCWRALKGMIGEIFINESDSIFEHVDSIGYDLIAHLSHKIKIECKSTPILNKNDIKSFIRFRLKNSNGSGRMNITKDNTADIYICYCTSAIGYVTRDIVLQSVPADHIGDIDVKIPKENFNVLYQNNDPISSPEPIINIPELITTIFKCISRAIWDGNDTRQELKNCIHEFADNL